MANLRWYSLQLAGLPTATQERLRRQLRRYTRNGELPSRRQWRHLLERACRPVSDYR